MPKQGLAWTEARVATLRSMWLDGAGSGAIARELGGVTRSAVMGKVDRLGLMGAKRATAASHVRVPAVAVRAPVAVAKPPAVAKAPPIAKGPAIHPLRALVRAALAPAGSTAAPPAPRAAAPARSVAPVAKVAKAPRPAKPLRVVAAPTEIAAPIEIVLPVAEEPVEDRILKLFPWEVARDDGRPTLIGLRAESCRWPIGDPTRDGFHYCGGEALLPKPYCSEHCSVAFQVQDKNRVRTPWTPMRIAQARQATLARLRGRGRKPARVGAA